MSQVRPAERQRALPKKKAAIQELLHKADHEAKVGDNPAAYGGQADLSTAVHAPPIKVPFQ